MSLAELTKQCTSLLFNHVKVPQRVVLCIFGFLAIVNAYGMRHCLDVAMSHITFAPEVTPPKNSACQVLSKLQNSTDNELLITIFNVTSSFIQRQEELRGNRPTPVCEHYNWSKELQTVIIVSFYVGYVISHVPGARLAEKYGGKWVLGAGMAATAFLTLITPWAIKTGGPAALICVRVAMGLSEGPTVPAISTLLAQWVPAKERGKLGVVVYSGGQAGVIFLNFVSGLIFQTFKYDWAWIFYFFGGCALVWFACFVVLCYSEPESNPFIEEREKQYLRSEIRIRTAQEQPMPWQDILTNLPVWALISATVQRDWNEVMTNCNVRENLRSTDLSPLPQTFWASLRATMPFMLNWVVSLASGALSDFLINSNICSTTETRQLMTTIAALGPVLITALSSCFSCGKPRDGVLGLINFAASAMGAYYAGINLTPLDMSPTYAGTLMGIANSAGALTGIAAPLLEKIAPDKQMLSEVRSAILLACTVFTSGEVQSFDPMAPNKQTDCSSTVEEHSFDPVAPNKQTASSCTQTADSSIKILDKN